MDERWDSISCFEYLLTWKDDVMLGLLDGSRKGFEPERMAEVRACCAYMAENELYPFDVSADNLALYKQVVKCHRDILCISCCNTK